MTEKKNTIQLCSLDKLEKKDILRVELDLTGTCNLDCPLCIRSYKNAKHLLSYNQRSAVDIIDQLEEFPCLKVCTLAGSISEPTLHTEFKTIIKYLVGRGILLELNSNASVHSTEWWADLATIMGPRDKVYFTICGSTQEIHEKYRVKSSLARILENHKAFKDACPYKIDYCQHIRFEYNSDDFDSPAMKKILLSFSHTANIDSHPYNERFKFFDNESEGLNMIQQLARHYNVITESAQRRYTLNKTGDIKCRMQCKSLETRYIGIDQFGEITPCFLYKIYKKDQKFDLNYEEINKFTHDFCYECESMTTKLLETYKLERMI